MVRSLIRFFLIFFAFTQVAASCQGTETGNPSYRNDDFDVETEYESDWTVTESEPRTSTEDTDGGTGASDPVPAETGGIDTSQSPSAEFTDGTSTVTIFFVTLENEPETLLSYLQIVFPTRDFQSFSNGLISGFTYDNPEAGVSGGDQQGYYFLQGVTLLYVVIDLFEENDGLEKFETILNSLRFE